MRARRALKSLGRSSTLTKAITHAMQVGVRPNEAIVNEHVVKVCLVQQTAKLELTEGP